MKHEAEEGRNPLAAVRAARVVSRRAPLLLITATLLTLVPAAARATDPPSKITVRLRYVVGPGIKRCPSEQTIHDEVAHRMGRVVKANGIDKSSDVLPRFVVDMNCHPRS